MHHKTLKQMGEDLQNKTYSSVELTQHFLQRIARYNPELNAYITVTEQQALEQAKQADERRAAGEHNPLLGIPLAHKDIFCTQGVLTTCGSKMLQNFVSPYNAHCVDLLQNAGMVTLGKTNMDEFAMGSSNETSYYGAVKNPWDVKAVPGGSSGGSAAAVAAGLAPVATATDTGGSIRQPAALCGVTGLKPSYGRISRYGMIAFASSLDQAGPIGRCAEDTALLLQVMAGFDAKDSTSAEQAVDDYVAGLAQDIKGMKIGIPKEYWGAGLDQQVAQQVQSAIQQLEKLGAKLVDISLPNQHLAVPTYYVIAPAEASSNLSRYDGVRYGYRCEDPKDLHDLYTRSRSEGFGNEVKQRIMVGTYALSSGYYDAYYLQAQKLRRLISNDFEQAFQQVDLIVGPTSPTVAFDIGDKTEDPVNMYLSDVYTIAINLAGLPAISIPVGTVGQRPVGMQIIGRYFQEAQILQAAHQFQLDTDWHQQTAEGYAS